MVLYQGAITYQHSSKSAIAGTFNTSLYYHIPLYTSCKYFLNQKAHQTNCEEDKINIESQHLDINLLNTEAHNEISRRNEIN